MIASFGELGFCLKIEVLDYKYYCSGITITSQIRIGGKGKTLGPLKPQGRISVLGHSIDATSEGTWIDGDVEVVIVGGNTRQAIVRFSVYPNVVCRPIITHGFSSVIDDRISRCCRRYDRGVADLAFCCVAVEIRPGIR